MRARAVNRNDYCSQLYRCSRQRENSAKTVMALIVIEVLEFQVLEQHAPREHGDFAS